MYLRSTTESHPHWMDRLPDLLLVGELAQTPLSYRLQHFPYNIVASPYTDHLFL